MCIFICPQQVEGAIAAGITTMLGGGTLRTRTLPNQQTETRLGCTLLNRMLQLAKPESYPVNEKA